jgi:hypothetical protein
MDATSGFSRLIRRLAQAAIAAAILLTTPATVAKEKSGWKLITFPGIAPSRFIHVENGRIDVVSDSSSAMLYRALAQGESGRRYLSWSWRVDTAPPATDITRRGGDRPLAVHLCFKGKPREGFLDWMGDVVRPGVEGFSRDHRCLTYVWGGNTRAGRMFPNPYMSDRGVMFVLRGSETPTGKWFAEKVDCARDYEAAFGETAPKPTFLAISGDSDGTRSMAAGSIARLVFTD